MFNKALVSIIIPNYNRAKLIGDTLDSILAQSYTHWECIIVDDGSTDDSKNIILNYAKKDPRVNFYERPVNKPKGANACRNYGLELSKGTYVNWFDSDDIMHQDKLRLQVAALELNNKHFCVCQSYLFEGTIKTILGLRSNDIVTSNPFNDFLKKQLIIPIQAPIFRKKFLIDNAFYFDETLQAAQEWELFARILLTCEDYLVINEPLDYIRKHPNSISGLPSSKKPLWYYFLARYKIYKHYESKLSIENKDYLKRYFLMIYKLFLRQHDCKKAYKLWLMSLLPDRGYTMKQHFLLVVSFISFLVFGKGDVFLMKVKRWDK